VRFTGRAEGDLGHLGEYVHEVRPDVEARRRAVLDRQWTWLRQVHGDRIVRVEGAGDGAGSAADGSVTTHTESALAVLTADCAPVALAAFPNVVAVVHAGWRGLLAGVIERAAEAVRTAGGTDVVAAIGPCIHPECYEFGGEDLDLIADAIGPEVRSRTSGGIPALDLPAAVRASLVRARVEVAYDADACTACAAERFFSHRARREKERQAVVAWLA
jgi:purine-nucleoside/S-methyl-5'-thioadenosine phosphorylase / adenosine deaminase